MKTSVTYKQLMLFNNAGSIYHRQNPGTVISKFLEKVIKANKDVIEEYYEKVDDINLDCALVDLAHNPPKIVFENAQANIYAMDKEGKKKQMLAIKNLNRTNVDVTFKHLKPSDIPADLDPDLKEIFTPFVIEPAAVAVED